MLAQRKLYEAEGEVGKEKFRLSQRDKINCTSVLGSSKRIMHGVCKKLQNRVAKKQIERDKREVMICQCNNRGILQSWVDRSSVSSPRLFASSLLIGDHMHCIFCIAFGSFHALRVQLGDQV